MACLWLTEVLVTLESILGCSEITGTGVGTAWHFAGGGDVLLARLRSGEESRCLTCGHSMPLHFSWCEFNLPALGSCWLPQYLHFAYTLLLTRISTKCCQTVDWIFRSSALIHGDCCLKFSFWLYTSWDENWFNVAMIYNFIFRERVMVKPQNVSLNWLSRTIPIFWKGMKKPLNN